MCNYYATKHNQTIKKDCSPNGYTSLVINEDGTTNRAIKVVQNILDERKATHKINGTHPV